jgi:hypothetical protein
VHKCIRVVVCAALCCGLASSCWATSPDLATADWSVRSVDNLAANPPREDAILSLLTRLGVFPGNSPYAEVKSARFADLRHSGQLSLVVSATDARQSWLAIVDRTPSGFEVYDLDERGSLEGIEDLAHNGRSELIVGTPLADTGFCMDGSPIVFAWTGRSYTNVSDQHKTYYEQKLASLKEQIASDSAAAEETQSSASIQTVHAAAASKPVPVGGTISQGSFLPDLSSGPLPVAASPPQAPQSLPPTSSVKPDLRNADCTKAEAAKIERFLGIDNEAGLSDAIKWARSEDPGHRELASFVLRDIGTPDALEYLKSLSHDSSEEVARVALVELGQVQHGASTPEFIKEPVEPLIASPRK